MALIKLTQGYNAIVDDDDWFYLNLFTWHARVQNNLVYATRWEKHNQPVNMHREIMGLCSWNKDKRVVDHINGDGIDNRKCNLRIVSSTQNAMNKRKNNNNTTSKYKGVSKVNRNKNDIYWTSNIRIGNKIKRLGYYPFTPEGEIAAAKAYDEAAKKLRGEYARLNFT